MNRTIISLLLAIGFIPQALSEELRVWNRSDGTIVRLESIQAITSSSVGDDYGRYLKWEYSVERQQSITKWSVVGDCQSLSADWDDDREGFIDLRRPNDNSSSEARSVLDEFCPQMNRLVQEAKGLRKKKIERKIPQKRNTQVNTPPQKRTTTRGPSSDNPLFDKCKDAQDFEGCIDVFTNKRQSPKRNQPKPSQPKVYEPIQRQSPKTQPPERKIQQPAPAPKVNIDNEPPVGIPEKLSPIQKACIDARSTGFRGYYSQRLKIKCRKILKNIPFL